MTSERQPSVQTDTSQRKEGVLFKRRDVFKNKWRPRWFQLHSEEAVLTYFLLSKTQATPNTISTPLRRPRDNNGSQTGPSIATTHRLHSSVSDLSAENETTSTVSENPVDYDVVPRGSIYLVGCKVSINDNLSLPQEGLFAFSIVPPNSDETAYHLAARTEESRKSWVDFLSIACNASAERDNDNHTTNEGSSTHGASSWKSQSSPDEIFDNVPSPLAAKLEQSLESHLELCEDVSPALRWNPIFQDRDGVSAFQRQDLHGRVMMKCTATIPHHPKQLLNLLLDPRKRCDYETNIAATERLEVLNSFTFLDYYATKAVWPTAPRDFSVVLHWQILQRKLPDGSQEEAAVILAFSCPEAEALKERTSSHVRASLHASLYLIRQAGDAKCHITRILSYDLGGSLPRNLATTVMMQQAALPKVLSSYLKRVEPTPPEHLTSNPLTNEIVQKDIVQKIIQDEESDMIPNIRRKLSFEKDSQNNAVTSPKQDTEASQILSVPFIALVLMMPLLVHRLTTVPVMMDLIEVYDLRFLDFALVFPVLAFLALRLVVLNGLGQELPNPRGLQFCQGGPVTCTMNIDLKGVLRYIGNKKEDNKKSVTTVSVVHIIATACSRAMLKHSDCWNYRRVCLPFFGIDGLFCYSSSTRLDVALSLATGSLLLLDDLTQKNVESMSVAMQAAEQRRSDVSVLDGILSRLCSFMDYRDRRGRCLIIFTRTDMKGSSHGKDSGGAHISVANIPSGFDVVVTIGDVCFEKSTSSVGSPLRTSPPKPILSLSITINTASVLDTSKCFALADELKKLIQFPELCDD